MFGNESHSCFFSPSLACASYLPCMRLRMMHHKKEIPAAANNTQLSALWLCESASDRDRGPCSLRTELLQYRWCCDAPDVSCTPTPTSSLPVCPEPSLKRPASHVHHRSESTGSHLHTGIKTMLPHSCCNKYAGGFLLYHQALRDLPLPVVQHLGLALHGVGLLHRSSCCPQDLVWAVHSSAL